MLSCTLSQQCVLFILLCLKEFSQFVPDEKHREKERIEGGQTDRKRERVRLGVFLTSLHFSLTPRSFSKAFSKKKKTTAVWWIKQQQQPLPSLPSRLQALIFQSPSVPVLCLFYTLLSRWTFSFKPMPSLSSAISLNLFPHTPSSVALLQLVPSFALLKPTFHKARSALRIGATQKVSNAFGPTLKLVPFENLFC